MDDTGLTAVQERRSSRLPWALLAGALVVAAWALWRAFGPAQLGDPLATSLAAFEKQNRLTVFSAQLSPVVSSDREWFKKTVIANGNHIAVWINGYQVSDFYDTRPVHAEADGKNGYVPDAGTINLQGHDPTTNLSFKNINIQTYPGK